MITRAIHEFIGRDWGAARASKDEYWGERIARLGPLEAWRIADGLRQQARRQDPDWPSAESRDEDVRFHVQMAQQFRRARSARRA